ncbi:MAG: addiction module toxin RelE [Oscillospiraceae bacterium]|nr:addiction module toxin RelE [Oscillospiraceae bacterium]
MKLILGKQPRKYLRSVDAPTRAKLGRALDALGRGQGDVVKLAGHDNEYRYKIEHYRIIFSYDRAAGAVNVIEINTRGNISY